LTKRALVIILVGFALLLIAATIRSGWLYLVASVLFALVIIGLLSGWLASRAISVSRRSAKQVFEREPFEVALRVSNNGRLDRHLVRVRDMQFPGRRKGGLGSKVKAQRAEFKEFMRTGKATAIRATTQDSSIRNVTIENLPGHSGVDVTYTMEAPRRGIFAPAEMRVSSGGVFGSAEIGHKSAVGSSLTVFPKIFPVDSFRFEPKADLAPVAPIEWSRKGIGQDYYGIREYVRGDSLRHIHWRSSARQGELIVKEYEQELKPSVVIVLALWAPEFGDAFDNSMEDSLRAAASVVSLQESMGNLPLLVVPEGQGFVTLERPTLFGCLASLAAFEPADRRVGHMEGVRAALASATESMLPGSAVVLITNAPPDRVASAIDGSGPLPGGTVVLVLDDSYGPKWKDEWLDEAPWLAGFVGKGMDLCAITAGRDVGRCLSEPLNITA
jgi:uncharacterized protein (DUF58 family)